MGKREPQIILKTDERKIHLELGLEGKIRSEINGVGREPVFLEGDRLEVAVVNGRCRRSRRSRNRCCTTSRRTE
jgi:hypothetical protein